MIRKLAISVILAAAAGASFADDITVDNTPFTSTATRAEVRAELAGFKQSGVNPWSNQYNQLAQFSSQRSRAAVSAEYTNSREQVAAFTSEDSGSAYLAARNSTTAATTLAGQPRNPR
jgi:hypothetical protein